jgi:hypothetical protein
MMVLSHNLSSVDMSSSNPFPCIDEYNHMAVFDQHVDPYLRTRQKELYILVRDTYYANNDFQIWLPPNCERSVGTVFQLPNPDAI